MEIPDFIGGSYKGYSSPVNPQRCVNFFPVLDREGGKVKSLQGTPGLKELTRWGRAAQDLTGYTEVDASTRFGIAESVLTVTALQYDETACLYEDFTADFFDTNFTHEFDINISAVETLGYLYPWVMSNRAGEDMDTHSTNERDFLSVQIAGVSASTFTAILQERNGAAYQGSSYPTLNKDTTYYMRVTRNETVGDYGLLTLDIFSDSDRTVLVASNSLTLTEKEDFRYLYFGNSLGTAGQNYEITGTVSNPIISSDTLSYAEVRGISAAVNGVFYIAVGSDILKYDSGTFTDKGNLSTSTGPVYLADNGSKVILVDGAKGWSIVADTVAEIVDGNFPANPTSCAYQDGVFMVSAGGTDDWYISDADDPTSWPGDYASKEGHRDNLSRLMSDSKNVWLFGEESYEVWYNSGDATFPFDRIAGTTRMIGLGARASLAEDEGIFFWFTDNRRAMMSVGYDAIPISTPQIEYIWGNYTTVSDAIGIARTQEGHAFYTLIFPTENTTWEFDATTGYWHELESSEGNRWRGNCYTFYAGKHYVGDFELSKFYEIDTDTYTDNGVVVKRIRTANELQAEGRMIFFGGLEIIGETGVATAAAPGDDPQMTLDWSDDGGRTWSTAISMDWGTFEDYTARAKFNRLGASRSRIFRIALEDQVKAVITGARHVPQPTIGNY